MKHHERRVYKRQLAAPKSFLNFPSQKQFTSFSYQHSISTTKPHDLQHYCFLGQTHLHRLGGLWKKSRQIWLIFWSQNGSNCLDVKLVFFEKDNNRGFRVFQKLTMGEAGFMHLKNQVDIAAENFGR